MAAEDHLRPEQFFHASHPRNRDSIRERGLLTSMSDDDSDWKSVYMSPKPSSSPHEDVWSVNTAGLKVEPDDPGNMHEFGDVGGSYFTDSDIEPHRLSLHREAK